MAFSLFEANYVSCLFLCLFHFSQSPEIAPDKRQHIRVCTMCRQGLESVQIENYKASCMKGEEEKDCMTRMNELFHNIIKFQDKIDVWLPKVLSLVFFHSYC